MTRFVVTELEGYGLTYRKPGLSCHVIDTAINRRLVAIFRSEDARSRDGLKPFDIARLRAQAKADALNELLP